MPNHVTNEIIFLGLTEQQRSDILATTLNTKGEVDFNILLPVPLNAWMFSVGERHEKAFRLTALDWRRENWGTKWGAYQHRPVEQDADTLKFTFDTAWRPPYGWLSAVFNRHKVSFDHNWFDEGADKARTGKFRYPAEDDDFSDPWTESVASEDETRRMHVLKWGVESFEDDDADASAEA